MRCQQCRAPIIGAAVQVGRVAFHPEHFRCASCDRPISGQFLVAEGSGYHPSCYRNHLAPRCDLCREGILGDSLLDHWGNRYHLGHRGKVPECRYCGRFISPQTSEGGVAYGDGRTVCTLCHRTAVSTVPGARELAERVRAMLISWGVPVPDAVPLSLVDRNQLARVLRGQGHALDKTNAFTAMRWETVGRQVTRREVTIHILSGLPRDLFEGTMAHEFLHVWNFVSGHPAHTPALEEGACNYLKYRVHEQQEGTYAAYQRTSMETDPDPAYGEGFRRARRYAERNGLAALLRLLERSRDFPLLY